MDDHDILAAEEFVGRLIAKGKKEETNLQKKVQKYLNSKGAYCFKVHGSIYMKSGIPDIICCYKGLFIGIECKIGKNKMSDTQISHQKQIIKAKGIHILAYNLEDVKKVIENL